MSETLVLASELRGQLEHRAREAFPRECCGLVEGAREHAHIRATAIHPTRNLAREPDRFEIDPAEHIALMRALRGSGREIVACYHSHPNGGTDLSPRDLAGAFDEDLVWIVIALEENARMPATVRAFRSSAGHSFEVTIICA